MAARINKNRYRLITLLYLIFVCLSVLNIPANLLDSNIYSIKTFEFSEEQALQEIAFAQGVLATQKGDAFPDSVKANLLVSNRIDDTYNYLNKIDSAILNDFKKNSTSVQKEFSSRRRIEKILLNDSTIYKLRDTIFSLHNYLISGDYMRELKSRDIIPISHSIINESGKKYEWAYFLFLHKPVAISYQQLKRLKFLLLAEKLFFIRKAMSQLKIQVAYYSAVNKKAYTAESLPYPINRDDTSFSKVEMDSIMGRQERISKELVEKEQKIKSPIINSISTPSFSSNEGKKKLVDTINPSQVFDRFFQDIINSLNAENLYAGVENELISDFKYVFKKDYIIEISPNAEIRQTLNGVTVKFLNQGDYKIEFRDLRNGDSRPLFSKQVNVSLLPNPIVRLNNEQEFKDKVNIKDLFYANGLRATLGLKEFKFFPGRINGYRITRISDESAKQSTYNYGEVFQTSSQEIISSLKRGEILLIDNVTVSLFDGTTRNCNPLIFKISE